MGIRDWTEFETIRQLVKHTVSCCACLLLAGPPALLLYLAGRFGIARAREVIQFARNDCEVLEGACIGRHQLPGLLICNCGFLVLFELCQGHTLVIPR